MKTIILMILICFLSACSPKLADPDKDQMSGNEQGNASDNVPIERGSSWFLGDQEFSYCYSMSPKFGLSAEKIEFELQDAFRIWKDYVEEKGINEDLAQKYIEAQYRMQQPNGSRIPADQLKSIALKYTLSTKSKFLKVCDGSQSVHFYFGDESPLIRDLKKNYFNPTAFSYRTDYNTEKGIGKGVVWITPQGGLGEEKGGYPKWHLKNRLKGILIHEIGHIYGVHQHVPRTIMDEDMWSNLLGPEWTTEDQANIEYRMSHIDHGRELYFPGLAKASRIYSGMPAYCAFRCEALDLTGQFNFAFQSLVGRNAQGIVTSEYTKGVLQLRDTLGTYSFKLTFEVIPLSPAAISIFNVIKSTSNEGFVFALNNSLNHSVGDIYIGMTTSNFGENVELLASINYWSPLSIDIIKDGKRHALLFMNDSPSLTLH